jgi:hypothetical protein
MRLKIDYEQYYPKPDTPPVKESTAPAIPVAASTGEQAQPGVPPKLAPKFSVSEPPAIVATNRWLGIGAVLLAATAAAFMMSSRAPAERSDLEAAKAILAQYETPRTESERNYLNPIYAEALTRLDGVAPQSAASAEAQALAVVVRQRIADFKKRSELAAEQGQARVEEREKRNEEFFDAQRRAAQVPVKSFPECEHEGGHRGH